jgi:hypothetical protein
VGSVGDICVINIYYHNVYYHYGENSSCKSVYNISSCSNRILRLADASFEVIANFW